MKVLIVGYGSIARKHISALQSLYSDTEFILLRSSINAIKSDYTDIYSIKEVPSEINFIVLANPTANHEKSIIDLIQFKKPIFIEKPPLHRMNKAQYIGNELSKNNIKTYIACVLRFHPCLVFFKKYMNIEKKRINEVNIYCGSYLPEWRTGKNFRQLYSAHSSMGGGVHLDLFHEIDYAIWLLGHPEKSLLHLQSKSSLGVDAVDYANFLMIYPDFALNMVLNYYRRDAKRIIEIVFDDKTWIIDLINNHVTDEGNKQIVFSSHTTLNDLYKMQMKYFVDGINNNTDIFNTFDDSVSILKYCLNEKR